MEHNADGLLARPPDQLRAFVSRGRITAIPAKRTRRRLLLDQVAQAFEPRPQVPGSRGRRGPQAGLRRPLRAAPVPGRRAVHVPHRGRRLLAGRRHCLLAPSASPGDRQPRSSPAAAASARPASPTPAAATNPAGASSGSVAAQVLALINQARSAAGLPALTITVGLSASASAHNSTMAGGCGLSHQCPGEPDLGARETAAGVRWTAAGENIGEGGPVAGGAAAIARMAASLTQAMLNEKPPDDGHRKNILSSSFTHIGIAVFRDSSGTVWLTQDFSN